MTNKILLLSSCAWLFFFWLAGCGPTRLAGGTETQNPEVVACVKKLAGAAFDAADAENKWQPSSYLRDSATGAALEKTAKRLGSPGDSSLVLSEKVTASKSDTLIIGDSMIIRDSALVKVTEIRFDTVIVDSTRFFIDTVADTIRSAANGSSRILITVRLAADSIIIKDTVIVTDTIDQRYQRVTVTVKRIQAGVAPLTIDTTSTQRFYLDTFSNKTTSDASTITGTSELSPAPSWKLDSIGYSSTNSPITYRVVSVPTKDTMVVSPNVNALRIRNNELFLSSKVFDNDILVQTVTFDAIDSLLSIDRFNPSPQDTVENMTTDYSVDIGADKFSGEDDRLLAIERSFSYRLGPFHRCALTLRPDQTGVSETAQKIYGGTISMTIIRGDKTGIFSGALDNDRRLIGIFEYDGKKYQVSCDGAYPPSVVETAP